MGANASQTFNLSSTANSTKQMSANATSPFSLHDTVASSMLFAAIAAQVLNLSSVARDSSPNLFFDSFTTHTDLSPIGNTTQYYYQGQREWSDIVSRTIKNIEVKLSNNGNIVGKNYYARLWTTTNNNLVTNLATSNAVAGDAWGNRKSILFTLNNAYSYNANDLLTFTINTDTIDANNYASIAGQTPSICNGSLCRWHNNQAMSNNYPTYDLQMRLYTESGLIAFCVDVLGFSSSDLAGLQAVAQMTSALTTTAGTEALANFVRTASSAFNMPSTANRARTVDAALASLISSLTTATSRKDAQATAQATANLTSTATKLATLLSRAIELISMATEAGWAGDSIGLLASTMGISSTALVSRFITAISLSALTFTSTLVPKLTFNVTLDEHVSLHDTIAILRTVATVCAEAFNIRDISYWLSATGAVSVTFHLTKGEITFALTKPSIEARLSKPTIDFD
jgi:hypothetical protein